MLHRILGILLVVAAAVLAGCDSKPVTGTVSGNVSYAGKAIPAGTITFVSESKGNPTASSPINDGAYQVQIVVGAAKISVTTPAPAAAPPPGIPDAGGASVKSIAIPPQYGSTTTSNLSFEVKPGTQKHDVDLK